MWTSSAWAASTSSAYELQPGSYELESFEPYTLRYLKLIVLEGDCEVQNLYLREYAGAGVWQAHFAASDERLNRLFAAGRETFRQNALDIFMDCPSRERAGWLCDSFFTARVAKDLCGDTRIEKNFFENFLLPPKFAYLPDGMLPMCYPADHNDGVFIPNWALWFVVELEEYLARSGDRETVDALRPRVLQPVRLLQEVPERGRPAGEAGKLGLRGVVRRQLIRAGRELPLEHALRQGARRGGQDVWPVRS